MQEHIGFQGLDFGDQHQHKESFPLHETQLNGSVSAEPRTTAVNNQVTFCFFFGNPSIHGDHGLEHFVCNMPTQASMALGLEKISRDLTSPA
jgi:hypothetical protein